MKKTLIAVLVALTFVGVLTPSAHALGVYGIWWMPDDSDEDGYGIGLKNQRNFTRLLALDARLSYINFSDPDASVVPIELTGLVHLGLVYGGVGLGYYFFSGDAPLNNAFGWYVLLGAEIAVRKWGIFGEIKWQSLDPDLDLPSGGSANLDAFAIHIGATVDRLFN
jgi:hypothetical protein